MLSRLYNAVSWLWREPPVKLESILTQDEYEAVMRALAVCPTGESVAN